MRCKACDKIMSYTTRQISVKHPNGDKSKVKIEHEEEDMCPSCIRHSELYFNADDDLNFSELGLDIPTPDYSPDY